MATHSTVLAWRIPWTEGPDGLWDCRESDMPKKLTHTHTHTHTHTGGLMEAVYTE